MGMAAASVGIMVHQACIMEIQLNKHSWLSPENKEKHYHGNGLHAGIKL